MLNTDTKSQIKDLISKSLSPDSLLSMIAKTESDSALSLVREAAIDDFSENKDDIEYVSSLLTDLVMSGAINTEPKYNQYTAVVTTRHGVDLLVVYAQDGQDVKLENILDSHDIDRTELDVALECLNVKKGVPLSGGDLVFTPDSGETFVFKGRC